MHNISIANAVKIFFFLVKNCNIVITILILFIYSDILSRKKKKSFKLWEAIKKVKSHFLQGPITYIVLIFVIAFLTRNLVFLFSGISPEHLLGWLSSITISIPIVGYFINILNQLVNKYKKPNCKINYDIYSAEMIEGLTCFVLFSAILLAILLFHIRADIRFVLSFSIFVIFLWSRYTYLRYYDTKKNDPGLGLNILYWVSLGSTYLCFFTIHAYLNPILLDSVPLSSMQTAAKVGLGPAKRFANQGVLLYAPQNTSNYIVEEGGRYVWRHTPRPNNAAPFLNRDVVDTFNRPRLLPLLLSTQHEFSQSKAEYTQLLIDKRSHIAVGTVLVGNKNINKLIVFMITKQQYNQHPEYLSSGYDRYKLYPSFYKDNACKILLDRLKSHYGITMPNWPVKGIIIFTFAENMYNGLYKVWRPFPGYWNPEMEFPNLRINRGELSSNSSMAVDQVYFSPFGSLKDFSHLRNAHLVKAMKDCRMGCEDDLYDAYTDFAHYLYRPVVTEKCQFKIARASKHTTDVGMTYSKNKEKLLVGMIEAKIEHEKNMLGKARTEMSDHFLLAMASTDLSLSSINAIFTCGWNVEFGEIKAGGYGLHEFKDCIKISDNVTYPEGYFRHKGADLYTYVKIHEDLKPYINNGLELRSFGQETANLNSYAKLDEEYIFKCMVEHKLNAMKKCV